MRGGRQLFNDGLEFALHALDHDDGAEQDQGRDDRGADGARQAQLFQPGDDGIEGVGNEYAEDDGNEEFLCPLQRINEADGGDDAQGHATRMDMQRQAQGGVQVLHGRAGRWPGRLGGGSRHRLGRGI